MDDSVLLSDVTFVLICFNEETYIQDIIESIKSLGITNILVVNDGSADDTGKRASKKNVTVVDHHYNYGHGKAFLTGVYSVKTKYAFIADTLIRFDKLDKKQFLDFIRFGIYGNYSLLLPEKNSYPLDFDSIYRRSYPKISSILKRQYNVDFPEPLLYCAFVGSHLFEKMKENTIGNEYGIVDLLLFVSLNKLKIGTFPLKLYLSYPHLMRHNEAYKKLNRAFPELRVQRIKDQVFVAVFGYLCIRTIEYIVTNFL